MQKLNPHRKVIVITGGPCGGKTMIIKELRGNIDYAEQIITLPEAIFTALKTNISPKDKLFQKIIVEIQAGMEYALDSCNNSDRIIICNRGTLDPFAYWINSGWEKDEFFSFTETSVDEHYDRYTAVIHLQSTAINAREYYLKYPRAERHEPPEEAAKIDKLLYKSWMKHKNYFFIENNKFNWREKKGKALSIIEDIINY